MRAELPPYEQPGSAAPADLARAAARSEAMQPGRMRGLLGRAGGTTALAGAGAAAGGCSELVAGGAIASAVAVPLLAEAASFGVDFDAIAQGVDLDAISGGALDAAGEHVSGFGEQVSGFGEALLRLRPGRPLRPLTRCGTGSEAGPAARWARVRSPHALRRTAPRRAGVLPRPGARTTPRRGGPRTTSDTSRTCAVRSSSSPPSSSPSSATSRSSGPTATCASAPTRRRTRPHIGMVSRAPIAHYLQLERERTAARRRRVRRAARGARADSARSSTTRGCRRARPGPGTDGCRAPRADDRRRSAHRARAGTPCDHPRIELLRLQHLADRRPGRARRLDVDARRLRDHQRHVAIGLDLVHVGRREPAATSSSVPRDRAAADRALAGRFENDYQ